MSGLAPRLGEHTVRLTKHRSTWHWFHTNPQGGGFGSNNCGPKHAALARATYTLAPGTTYRLIVNERDCGFFTIASDASGRCYSRQAVQS